jgi:DNA invertase Pin-like site-specific DNA recombinase
MLPDMVGAVIYVRVSTKEQTENLSLPTQLKACEEYCERQGFKVLARFREEGESAKTADRTELQKLLQFCRKNKGTVQFVVVFNLTRFAREKYDHFALRAHLKSLGISLRSATEPIDDTSTGKLMEGVLAAFAQFDNDVRSERTRGGMKAALELGRWTFLAPLGYLNPPRSTGRSLVPDPERAPLVRRAFQEFATGRFTKEEVLKNVNALGLTTRRGRPVPSQTFDALLRNRVYIGQIDVPDFNVSTRGDFEPLVTERIFFRVQSILDGPRNHGAARTQRSRLPATRVRSLRDLRQTADGELVEGPQRVLRVLPLPRRVPRGQHHQSEARRIVRGRTDSPAANAGFPATREGSRASRVAGDEGRGAATNRCRRAPAEIDSPKAGPFGRRLSVRTVDRHRHLRPSPRQAARGAHARANGPACATELEEMDVEGILGFAERVLPSASNLWLHSSLNQKQRLQQVFFPDSVRFGGTRLVQTGSTLPIFNYLAGDSAEKVSLVDQTGVEPVTS